MPNSYAEKHFRQGKLRALVNLISALQDEELPRERGHSFKAGQVEKYLDLDSPLRPRTLLAVLREAEVPHDNNCRFLPWMIYDYLPALLTLHREYVAGLGVKPPLVERETGPGAEETGTVGEETGQEGREEKGDEAVAETGSGPSETRDKPEVEPGQGAVAVPRRRDRVVVAFEGISTLGQRILRVTPLGKPIPYYVVDMGIDSAGRRRHKRIGHERPPLLSTMEQPQAKRLDGQKVKTSRGGE
jgi:hypothetical protein